MGRSFTGGAIISGPDYRFRAGLSLTRRSTIYGQEYHLRAGLPLTAIGVGIMVGRFAPSFYKMLIYGWEYHFLMGLSFASRTIISKQDYHLRADEG